MAAVASKFTVKQSHPKRGEIKIKIFKMIGNSLKDLATGLAVLTMKAAGGVCGCFSSPATITPQEATGGLKITSIPKKSGNFVPPECSEFGGEKGEPAAVAVVVFLDGRNFLPGNGVNDDVHTTRYSVVNKT